MATQQILFSALLVVASVNGQFPNQFAIPSTAPPAQQFPGQQFPGQQFPGQQFPGSPVQQMPPRGQQQPGQPIPGMQPPSQTGPQTAMPQPSLPGQTIPLQDGIEQFMSLPAGQSQTHTFHVNDGGYSVSVIPCRGDVDWQILSRGGNVEFSSEEHFQEMAQRQKRQTGFSLPAMPAGPGEVSGNQPPAQSQQSPTFSNPPVNPAQPESTNNQQFWSGGAGAGHTANNAHQIDANQLNMPPVRRLWPGFEYVEPEIDDDTGLGRALAHGTATHTEDDADGGDYSVVINNPGSLAGSYRIIMLQDLRRSPYPILPENTLVRVNGVRPTALSLSWEPVQAFSPQSQMVEYCVEYRPATAHQETDFHGSSCAAHRSQATKTQCSAATQRSLIELTPNKEYHIDVYARNKQTLKEVAYQGVNATTSEAGAQLLNNREVHGVQLPAMSSQTFTFDTSSRGGRGPISMTVFPCQGLLTWSLTRDGVPVEYYEPEFIHDEFSESDEVSMSTDDGSSNEGNTQDEYSWNDNQHMMARRQAGGFQPGAAFQPGASQNNFGNQQGTFQGGQDGFQNDQTGLPSNTFQDTQTGFPGANDPSTWGNAQSPNNQYGMNPGIGQSGFMPPRHTPVTRPSHYAGRGGRSAGRSVFTYANNTARAAVYQATVYNTGNTLGRFNIFATITPEHAPYPSIPANHQVSLVESTFDHLTVAWERSPTPNVQYCVVSNLRRDRRQQNLVPSSVCGLQGTGLRQLMQRGNCGTETTRTVRNVTRGRRYEVDVFALNTQSAQAMSYTSVIAYAKPNSAAMTMPLLISTIMSILAAVLLK